MATPTFEQVYAECHREVYALCRNLVGNSSDAQDAMQETFIAVASALPSFRGDSSVKTWVHRIGIRAALKIRARSHRSFEPLDRVPETSTGSSPDERERNRRLATAMAALSFEHRIVLSLFAIDGLTHAEIAADLGVPEGTIWSRLHTAKKKLAAALATPAG